MTFRRMFTADGVHNYFWKVTHRRREMRSDPWPATASKTASRSSAWAARSSASTGTRVPTICSIDAGLRGVRVGRHRPERRRRLLARHDGPALGAHALGAAQDSVQAGDARRELLRHRLGGAAPGVLRGRLGRLRRRDGDRRREAQGLGLLRPRRLRAAERRHARQHDRAGVVLAPRARPTSRSTASTPTRARKCWRASPGRTTATAPSNPKAQFQAEVPMEQILKSPKVADPLGIMDCSGVSDGSAAAIVVRAEDAHKYCKNPIYIKALSFVAGPGAGPLDAGLRLHHLPRGRRVGGRRLPPGRRHRPARRDQHGRGARLLHADRAGALRGSRLQPARHGVAGRARRLLRPRRISCR